MPPQNIVRRRVLDFPNNAGTSEILADNYQVALLIKDKNDKNEAPSEIAIVTASSRFTLNVSELRLSFDGVIKLDDDGAALVQYSLRWETPVGEANMIQFVNSNVTGALHVRPGADPEIIFRSANRTVSLSLVKLPAAKAR